MGVDVLRSQLPAPTGRSKAPWETRQIPSQPADVAGIQDGPQRLQRPHRMAQQFHQGDPHDLAVEQGRRQAALLQPFGFAMHDRLGGGPRNHHQLVP